MRRLPGQADAGRLGSAVQERVNVAKRIKSATKFFGEMRDGEWSVVRGWFQPFSMLA
jgi:hypothetical protein